MSATQDLDDDRPDRYLAPEDVCRLVPGMTRANLAQLRFRGAGPLYRKPTPKTVVYLESEVIAWVESTVRRGTSEALSA
ncbi:hypothetical protein C5C56_11215 [Rathayibacter sp. AY1D1]|uniref:helix-turn-helix transcriptional regulator n=1 Tax=Rathayibacter sp. AY1D1 TaxID=2080542 RepID=UPI000CE8BFAB|nr:hypothetical protein [Rathayibacter sp. AY1D1]PPH98204.1 hypothetical protein C5C56_11215 [Rathayibacter sp. AY1D1]